MPADRPRVLPAWTTLAEFGAICVENLRKHLLELNLEAQMIQLGSEVGEALDAYGRWAGFKRRDGTLAELAAELADIMITAYITAEVLGADLDAALKEAQITNGETPGQQAVLLLKEAGLAAQDYLMWDVLGRHGSRHLTNIADRLANVVTAAKRMGELLDLDLDVAWRDKAEIVLTRGWKEPADE